MNIKACRHFREKAGAAENSCLVSFSHNSIIENFLISATLKKNQFQLKFSKT
jgi:hypothetical protein